MKCQSSMCEASGCMFPQACPNATPDRVADYSPRAQRGPRADILTQVEEAIRLAAKLGPDAFDFIEGRGLHQLRLNIAADYNALMSLIEVFPQVRDSLPPSWHRPPRNEKEGPFGTADAYESKERP